MGLCSLFVYVSCSLQFSSSFTYYHYVICSIFSRIDFTLVVKFRILSTLFAFLSALKYFNTTFCFSSSHPCHYSSTNCLKYCYICLSWDFHSLISGEAFVLFPFLLYLLFPLFHIFAVGIWNFQCYFHLRLCYIYPAFVLLPAPPIFIPIIIPFAAIHLHHC